MTENELKPLPCPSCGSDGYVERRANGWIARCAARFETCAINGRTHHMGSMDEAIAAWNQRATIANPDALRDVVEAARKALRDSPTAPWTQDLADALAKLGRV